MRSAGLALVVVVAGSVVGGACSSGGGSSLTMDDLRDAGNTCPVDLAGKVTVAVENGSGTGGADDSALDQAGGSYVTCTRPGDGDGGNHGDVTVILFGSKHKAAVGLLLPQISADLDMTTDELPKVVERYMAADDGELVALPDGTPAAIAPIDIKGAESGVLYVFAEGQSPTKVRQLAESLLADA